jgi:hypothetical protein
MNLSLRKEKSHEAHRKHLIPQVLILAPETRERSVPESLLELLRSPDLSLDRARVNAILAEFSV